MKRNEQLTRRSALTLAMGTAGALLAGGVEADPQPPAKPVKGRIKQSVSRWCYGGMALDALCERAKAMGLVGIDLLNEGDWETVKQHGLICTMAYGIGSIPDNWNHLENHDRLVAEAEKMIPKVAEDNKVTVCVELLNSKHDHKDYQCDHTQWGVELCKRVGSERIKLLYDIYHMQIMDGDVCATIKENIAYIAHFHTGGVPGRHEIDDSQELNYTRVCRAIVESGFKGYLAHEFNPTRDPMTSLAQAVQICDV
jgi:hydroxypyruvate isomerase